MVRQWQEFMYEQQLRRARRSFRPTSSSSPTPTAFAGATVRSRAEVLPTVDTARRTNGPFLINFMVEKEDAVYPMIAPGSALDEMVRRPSKAHNPLIETAEEP